jgi:hypothetical protein
MLRFKFSILLIAIVVILSPSLIQARWTLTPRLYVEEEYDDNLFLEETDEQDDFITTVSPGVNLEYETPTADVALDYELRRSLYRDFSDLDFTGHHGRVDARKDFGPRLSAGIREIFIKSQDPIELTGIGDFERPSVRIGERQRYTRNILQPDITLHFGERRSFGLQYLNNTLRNDRKDIADEDQNAFDALLVFDFNAHNGIELFYEHVKRDYDSTTPPEISRDHDGDEIRGRYIYRFDPRTSVFAECRYYERRFDLETPAFFDYQVYEPKLGFSRDLFENVSFSASAGYTIRETDARDDDETFFGRLDFSRRQERLTAHVYAETGFDEDFSSAENLGFSEFWVVGLNSTYQLVERLSLGGFFFVERDDFVDVDRTDKLWRIRGSLSYEVLKKWLFLSFDYIYDKRDSNLAFESYTDNRYIGRITTQFEFEELFQ